MKKSRLIYISLISLTLFMCIDSKKDKNNIDIKDQTHTVKNTIKPLYGEITLQLEEIFRINPKGKIPPNLSKHEKDKNGNIYIRDYKNRKILKFAKSGDFLLDFGRKGEGPGEFKSIRTFKVLADNIIVWGRNKISFFKKNGEFIRETKINKFYYPVTIVNENKFIVNFYQNIKNSSDKAERYRIVALIDKNEKILSTFFKGKNIGSTVIRKGNFTFSFSSSYITEDIRHSFNPENNLLYLAKTDDLKISIMTLDGKTKSIIQRDHKKIIVSKEDGKGIIKSFRNLDDDRRKMIRNNLPKNFCVVSSIKTLENGYFMVEIIKGIDKFEFNLFDNNGKFLYILKFDDNLSALRFYEDKVAGIESLDKGDSYVEYRIKNFNRIFKQDTK